MTWCPAALTRVSGEDSHELLIRGRQSLCDPAVEGDKHSSVLSSQIDKVEVRGLLVPDKADEVNP